MGKLISKKPIQSQKWFDRLRRRVLSLWYGFEYLDGYGYRKVKAPSLFFMEVLHEEMMEKGWERCSDIEALFQSGVCVWYRQAN